MANPNQLSKPEQFQREELKISFKRDTTQDQNASEAWGIIFLLRMKINMEA